MSKVVRGEIYAGGYIIEAIDQNTSQITYISHSDPKGSLPGMLKNALAVKQGEIASKIGPAMQANSWSSFNLFIENTINPDHILLDKLFFQV